MSQPALEAQGHDSGSRKSTALLPAVLGNLRRELLRAAVGLHPTSYMHEQGCSLGGSMLMQGPVFHAGLNAERLLVSG